jgi:hypothetical protein
VSDLLLTPQERERFVLWLDREAHSDRQIAGQLDALGGTINAALAVAKRADAAAMDRLAKRLRSTESLSV